MEALSVNVHIAQWIIIVDFFYDQLDHPDLY